MVDGIDNTAPTPEDIRRIRQTFQNSQYSDLRASGLALVDLMEEGVLSDVRTDPEVAKRFADAMTGFSTACTSHGVKFDLSN